jgi:uncharacterized protein YuzE
MPINEIAKDQWQNRFDGFSKQFLTDEQPEYAEIHILSERSGALEETKWLPLEGISYDPRKDILSIKLEDIEHMIEKPAQIYIDEDAGGWINSMEIIDEEGTKNIIELR